VNEAWDPFFHANLGNALGTVHVHITKLEISI